MMESGVFTGCAWVWTLGCACLFWVLGKVVVGLLFFGVTGLYNYPAAWFNGYSLPQVSASPATELGGGGGFPGVRNITWLKAVFWSLQLIEMTRTPKRCIAATIGEFFAHKLCCFRLTHISASCWSSYFVQRAAWKCSSSKEYNWCWSSLGQAPWGLREGEFTLKGRDTLLLLASNLWLLILLSGADSWGH